MVRMSTVVPMPDRASLASAVAANVRAEAARRRVEQRDIARALAMSRAAVSDRFRGRTPWTLSEVEGLARFLRVSLEELLLPRLDSNQQPSDYVPP